jgi:hypothetical protein
LKTGGYFGVKPEGVFNIGVYCSMIVCISSREAWELFSSGSHLFLALPLKRVDGYECFAQVLEQ